MIYWSLTQKYLDEGDMVNVLFMNTRKSYAMTYPHLYEDVSSECECEFECKSE